MGGCCHTATSTLSNQPSHVRSVYPRQDIRTNSVVATGSRLQVPPELGSPLPSQANTAHFGSYRNGLSAQAIPPSLNLYAHPRPYELSPVGAYAVETSPYATVIAPGGLTASGEIIQAVSGPLPIGIPGYAATTYVDKVGAYAFR